MTSCIGRTRRGQGRVGKVRILRCFACVGSPHSINESSKLSSELVLEKDNMSDKNQRENISRSAESIP